MTRRSILLLVVVALLAGNLAYASLSGPSAFARDFDQNIARFPLAASIARSDPALRAVFLSMGIELLAALAIAVTWVGGVLVSRA